MAPGTSPARHCLAVCMASTMIAYLVQYTIGYYGVITASTVTGSGKGYEPALWSSTPNVAICFSLPSTKAPLIDTILSTNQEFLIRAPESGLAEREPPRTNLDASASVSRKVRYTLTPTFCVYSTIYFPYFAALVWSPCQRKLPHRRHRLVARSSRLAPVAPPSHHCL